MGLPSFADDCFEIDVASVAVGQTGVESRRGLAACFAGLIGFERAFDDFGDFETPCLINIGQSDSATKMVDGILVAPAVS